MSKKGKEQMDVAQVYDDDVTKKKRMLRRRGKTGKNRKSKKGKHHSSKSSKKSPILSTHSPSEMDRNTGGLFGGTSDYTSYNLYFVYDPEHWTGGPSCSISNVHYESGMDYVYSIRWNCKATTDSGRHYYEIEVMVIGETLISGHADYFNKDIEDKNNWDPRDGQACHSPEKLYFAFHADFTFGSTLIKDLRIGMGGYQVLFEKYRNWWVAGSDCEKVERKETPSDEYIHEEK